MSENLNTAMALTQSGILTKVMVIKGSLDCSANPQLPLRTRGRPLHRFGGWKDRGLVGLSHDGG